VVHSQRKGASGEREFSKAVEQLTGVSLERRLDQCRGGGHDLDVISGAEGAAADWLRAHAIEIKRYRPVTPALIAGWWRQAVDQARAADLRPLLAYRADRAQWQLVVALDEWMPGADSAHTATVALDALPTLAGATDRAEIPAL